MGTNYRESSEELKKAWFEYVKYNNFNITAQSNISLTTFAAGFNAAKAIFEKDKSNENV